MIQISKTNEDILSDLKTKSIDENSICSGFVIELDTPRTQHSHEASFSVVFYKSSETASKRSSLWKKNITFNINTKKSDYLQRFLININKVINCQPYRIRQNALDQLIL